MKRFLKTVNLVYDNTIMIAFILVLLIVGYYVYDAYYVYTHTLDKNIQNYKPSRGSVAEDIPITDDMVAWITIDGTDVDFPIMQGENNMTYLNTDPYGEYSLSGSIFLDYRNDPQFGDDYSIVYGHHMEYGKMFGTLDAFFDEDYIRSHRTGELLIGRNADKIYDLEVFACMKCDSKDERVFTPGSSEAVIGEIRDDAPICLDELNDDRRIVVLSTCSSGGADERLLVFCHILD